MLPYVRAFDGRLAITHPVPAQPLLANVNRATTTPKRVNNNVEWLSECIQQVVNDANVRVPVMLRLIVVLIKVPDVIQRRLPAFLFIFRSHIPVFWKFFQNTENYVIRYTYGSGYFLGRIARHPHLLYLAVALLFPGPVNVLHPASHRPRGNTQHAGYLVFFRPL